MASENGTVVNVFGYDSACKFRIGSDRGGNTLDSFTINLDKGETYVIEAAKDETPANISGWLGSSITSNKPIAISLGGLNVGIISGFGGRDTGIDQPVPTNVLGREYVFVRGNGSDKAEFPIIVGTQNSTEIYAGGTYLTTINNGDFYEIPGSYYSSAVVGANMYVRTSKDAYAYQCLQGNTTGSQTIGMNFIAPVNCLLPNILDEVPQIDQVVTEVASDAAITIVASTTTPNTDIIIKQNGVAIALPAPIFAAGTSDWKTFYINGLSGDIGISSTGAIAVGTLVALRNNTGLAGYFSGFDTAPVVEIETAGGGCFSNSDLEETTGGFDAYQWYVNGTPIAGATLNIYTPTVQGNYYVEVAKGGCSYPSAIVSVYNCDPDIVVKKEADVNTIDEGDDVTFTITAESLGIDPVTNLIINDVLPTEFDLVSAVPSNGLWNAPNWTIGTMNAGEIHTLTIVAKAKTNGIGGVVTNVVSNTQDQIDSNTTPDDLTESVTINSAGISITKTGIIDTGGDGLQVGDEINYTFEVQNTGQAILRNIIVNDPRLGAIVSGPLSGDANSDTILDITETWMYQGTYTILNTDIAASEVVNTATVSSNLTNGTIKSSTSNTLITDIKIADLGVSKSINITTPIVNNTVIFTIEVTNNGPEIATNIELNETLTSGYEYVSHTGTSRVYDEITGLWNIANLANGETSTLSIVAKVNETGDYEDAVHIIGSDQLDSDNSNNSASVNTSPICLTIYNEFSPNGDGVNETFRIDCLEQYPNNTLEVFNRWGNRVYKKKGYDNTWNGNSNGRITVSTDKKLPVGTYYYVLDLGDGSKPQKGWIYINR
jgi:gliding motility-associated-like protein/uncharacterized repeat protein (TIGR01451 family)